jgi:uncharacterized protein YjbI with pentapeptide repeats
MSSSDKVQRREDILDSVGRFPMHLHSNLDNTTLNNMTLDNTTLDNTTLDNTTLDNMTLDNMTLNNTTSSIMRHDFA